MKQSTLVKTLPYLEYSFWYSHFGLMLSLLTRMPRDLAVDASTVSDPPSSSSSPASTSQAVGTRNSNASLQSHMCYLRPVARWLLHTVIDVGSERTTRSREQDVRFELRERRVHSRLMSHTCDATGLNRTDSPSQDAYIFFLG